MTTTQDRDNRARSHLSGNFPAVADERLQAMGRLIEPLLTSRVTYLLAGLGILVLDWGTGRWLVLPSVFIIPVVMSAWFCGGRFAYLLAVLLSLGRSVIFGFVEVPASLTINIANALIRTAALVFVAFLVARTKRLTTEVTILEGLLPICMHCKRIRDEKAGWEQLEAYISHHSEATFTHGLCPECSEKHYGVVLKPE